MKNPSQLFPTCWSFEVLAQRRENFREIGTLDQHLIAINLLYSFKVAEEWDDEGNRDIAITTRICTRRMPFTLCAL